MPRIITRAFIQQHTEWIFLYGSDSFEQGALGQMWSCHGEPNSFPIYTCYKMCQSNRYWQDGMYNDVIRKLEKCCFDRIPKDNRPILPLRKIGEGASQLKYMAPRIFAYIKARLETIKYPEIKIDWKT